MTGTLAGGPVLTVQPEIAAIVNSPESMVSMIAAGEMVIRPAHAPPQVGLVASTAVKVSITL
jgi:hypothetical protein